MRRRRPVLLLATVFAAVLAGCSAPPGRPEVPPSVTVTPPAPPPTSPPAGSAQALPVYYVADTPAGPRLYREFHQVTTADPASDAVRSMLAAPTGTDPDYRNSWPVGTALRTPVTDVGGVTTVDLTGLGATPVDAGQAAITVQQLVFTVQGALQSGDPVRILVDGAPVDALWGVPTANPVPRGDPYQLRSLVQIDSPADGTTVGADVIVAGEAAVFEATVHWEVLRDNMILRSGVTSSAEGQRFAPYRFTVTLPPGGYTVRVLEDDPSGGAGRPVLTDDKAIVVR